MLILVRLVQRETLAWLPFYHLLLYYFPSSSTPCSPHLRIIDWTPMRHCVLKTNELLALGSLQLFFLTYSFLRLFGCANPFLFQDTKHSRLEWKTDARSFFEKVTDTALRVV
ncbi:hypothetical protein L208DRAFT_80620 [Tricholoma matsutake]|nr:hypothetical protein L208DRAFT_80620 [Tricholoma matsutake 945]